METLLRAKQGYSADIERLYKTSISEVYYVCLTLTNNAEKATAICKELYKKVFATLDRLSDETDFTAWMKNAAVVASISVLRKNNPYLLRHVSKSSLQKIEIEENCPLTTEQTARVFENTLRRMDFPARMATICYYFNNMTRAQLCRITDLDGEEVDTTLARAADYIAELSHELEEKGVVSTRIDPKALLELLCLEEKIPSIDPKTLYVSIEPIEETPVITPKKQGVKISVAAYVAVAAAVLVAAGVTATQTGLFGGKDKEPDTSSLVSSVTSSEVVSSEIASLPQAVVSSEVASSEVVSSEAASSVVSKPVQSKPEEIKPAVKPPKAPYLSTKAVSYDARGEKERTQQFSYSGGRIKTLQTKTDIFTETLTYNWTKNGRKCTITDNKGTVVEKVEYDPNGNPTKRVFTNDTVTFKWTYKYNKKGLIKTASYKSNTSGTYSYEYDSENRITRQKHSVGGDVYTTTYTYYEDGMISSRTETDFDGSQKVYNYTYNYTDMTYDISCSDGSREHGLIAKN